MPYAEPPPTAPPAAVVAQQANTAVVADLRDIIRRQLGLPAPTPRLAGMLAALGTPGFYDLLAAIDVEAAGDWLEMGRVQRQFAAAERGFDAATRAYSESMRLTLHAAVIAYLADPSLRGDASLFERFLELHVSAFRENGGWLDNLQIPRGGAFAVLDATRPTMALYAVDLLQGALASDPVAVRAARWVRDARTSNDL